MVLDLGETVHGGLKFEKIVMQTMNVGFLPSHPRATHLGLVDLWSDLKTLKQNFYRVYFYRVTRIWVNLK